MAEWKERGYVPDSDDEGEDGLDLPVGDGQLDVAGLNFVKQQEHERLEIDKHGGGSFSNAERQAGPLVQNDCAILLADPGPYHVDQKEDDSGGFLQRAEDGREDSPKKQEKGTHKNSLPEPTPVALDHTRVKGAGTSVGDKLQNELRSGLEMIKQVLGGSRPTLEGCLGDNSDLSSPLSSVKSFPAEDQPGTHASHNPSAEVLSLDPQLSEQRLTDCVEPTPGDEDHFGSLAQPTKRNLRQRNPIQLHPYALEGARFQKDMLEHGMKPFKESGVARQKSPDISETQNFDFQESSADEDAEEVTSSQPDSLPPLQPISNNVVKKRAKKQPSSSAPSDEDLPDLDAILEGKHAGLPRILKTSKRVYKALQTSGNLDFGKNFDVYNLPSDPAGVTKVGSQKDPVFYVPPSPPNSRSHQSSQSTEAFPGAPTRKPMPGGKTPQALPTPNISSAAQKPKDPRFPVDDDFDSSETGTEASSTSDSEDSPERGDIQILHLQRKTKGVLPASYFRLQDQKEQARRNQVNRSSSSPDRTVDAPGVAHRLSRPGVLPNSLSGRRHNAIVVSDDSSSDEVSTGETFEDHGFSNSPNRFGEMMGLVEGDIEEDNTINILGQPQTRRPKIRMQSKKRQRRISELGYDMNDHLGRGPSRRMTPKRRRKSTHREGGEPRRKQRNAKAKAPSLGPLDAPGYTDLPRAKQPHFLRLAARRARSRKTGSRQSPSQKFIRLATSADTRDANDELYIWRRSLLKQNANTVVRTPPRKAKPWRVESVARRLEKSSEPRSSSQDGQQDQLIETSSHSQFQVEQHSPLRFRTEDVIQRILRRQNGDPSTGWNNSPAPIRHSHSGDIGARTRHSATIHARHRNRSGRGMLLSSAMHLANSREAQLESPIQLKPRNRVLSAFRGRVVASTRDRVPFAANEGESCQTSPLECSDVGIMCDEALTPARPRPPRKRDPRQMNITSLDSAWQPRPSELVHDDDSDHLDPLSGVVLAGLGSPEFSVTIDFGVVPFHAGTCLHETTFIGQGHLSQVISYLVHQPKNLVRRTSGCMTVIRPSLFSSPYRWGVFDDQILEQFLAWFVELRNCLDFLDPQTGRLPDASMQNILAATTSLTLYLGSHICFPDHQAILLFAAAAVPLSQELAKYIQALFGPDHSVAQPDVYRFSYLWLVFIFEVACISASAAIEQRLQSEICSSFRTLAVAILTTIFRKDQQVKISPLSKPRADGLSIRREHPEVEALIVINHLSKQKVLQIDIWDLITEGLLSSIGTQPENIVTFQDYDRWWKEIFLALPLLEFDESGVLQRKSGCTGWDLVQRLLVRFLSLFMPRRHNTGYSTKHYGRILLQRCLELVQEWGWQGGHSANGTIFDAYSRNDLKELFGETPEQHFHLPLNLAPSGYVHIHNGDSGFHAFLGLTAQTILDCRKPEADPKLAKRVLRSLSARLVPTKGPDLLRDRTPNLHDIVALRNRLDLVAVMYCAMPREMKPSLRLFQSFVDFRNAHFEACKVALECWLQLVQHQDVDVGSINQTGGQTLVDYCNTAFALLREWHDSMIIDLLAEYSLTGHQALERVARGLSEHTDRRHTLSDARKPVAELLKDALKASEQSFGSCQTPRQATELLSPSSLVKVFRLHDAEDPASNAIVSAALQVVRAYTQKIVPRKIDVVSADEESQEYGSWDHFNAMDVDDQAEGNSNQDDFACLLHEVQPMLLRFVSSVFGSDIFPDHAILKNTTDAWFELADGLVRVKARGWDDFIGQYSSNSWESLRNTLQSRQYKVYFLAKVVDCDYGYYESNRFPILESWISAMCRPKGLLLWEHLFTSIILFHDSENELLFNPPFMVRSDAGERLDISMVDLRERRTAMIYVVLRNMHRLLATPVISSQTSFPYSKADFSGILKSIEATMKSHYQDLEADSPAQNDYRVFVNFVVQQMQLYVVDFHKIDPFFLDPAISSAQGYAITAALKRYSLTIGTMGITKAMVLFFYNASERAAISDNQDQFILQLQNAFLDLSQEAVEQTENHDSDAALLTLFLQHVFPAYVRHAFSSPGHLIAGPVLQVLTHAYQNLRCRANLWHPSLLQHLILATKAIFCSAVGAFQSCDSDLIRTSYQFLENFKEFVIFVHAAMLRVYEAASEFPDDVDASELIESLLVLKTHIFAVEQPADDDYDRLGLQDDEGISAEVKGEYSAIRTYAEKELQNVLDRTWRPSSRGGWEITGRGPAKVVNASRITVSGAASETDVEQCQQRTKVAVGEFLEAFVRLDWWE
jgi:Mus7/MMS22 family